MMKTAAKVLLTIQIGLLPALVKSQTADSIIADFEAIHSNIKSGDCSTQQIVSNRAMNIFLSDKIGSYLGAYNDLSLYKNNITFNSGDGIFSLNHNFFQASGKDEPVKSFLVVGVKTNAANAFAAAFSNKTFTNELGVSIKKSWIHKPSTLLNNCSEKSLADAGRQTAMALLITEIKQREQDYSQSLEASLKDVSDSAVQQTKETLLKTFHENVTEEFSWKFHQQQYQYLISTERFKVVKTSWTNLSVYLPVITQRFIVAGAFTQPFAGRNAYPFEISINHTRFWESKKNGRLFVTLDVNAFLNNSVKAQAVEGFSFDQYKNGGGSDTAALRQKNISNIYVGKYNSFISPSAKLRLVYFPHESHIGISTSIEQFAGKYSPLNWMVAIPVVLIDKVKAPAATFEFQLRFFDVTHKVFPGKKLGDNIMASMTLGVPFSKIVY